MGDTTFCAIWGFAAQYFAKLSTTTDFINGLLTMGIGTKRVSRMGHDDLLALVADRHAVHP